VSDAILVEDLVKQFPAFIPGRAPRSAVDGLDLRVQEGGVTGLLGPNGSGKTTTIKVLLGLTKPTSGRATVFGQDAWRESSGIRSRVAYVPAERTVFDWMQVGKFIDGVARLSKRWDSDYANRLMRRWEIDNRARLGHLSTGARSKILLVAALARRPDILLLDEPATGLDPAATDDALSELVGFAAEGTTILLLTHQIDVVDRICDRVKIMSRGRALFTSDLEHMRSSWAVIDITGQSRPEEMHRWEEVTSATERNEYTRLLVHAQPAAVVDRLRLIGAEIASVRPLALREVYLAITPRAEDDDSQHADANNLA
jgi:ABC-2 type transport system ATP-binding protein